MNFLLSSFFNKIAPVLLLGFFFTCGTIKADNIEKFLSEDNPEEEIQESRSEKDAFGGVYLSFSVGPTKQKFDLSAIAVAADQSLNPFTLSGWAGSMGLGHNWSLGPGNNWVIGLGLYGGGGFSSNVKSDGPFKPDSVKKLVDAGLQTSVGYAAGSFLFYIGGSVGGLLYRIKGEILGKTFDAPMPGLKYAFNFGLSCALGAGFFVGAEGSHAKSSLFYSLKDKVKNPPVCGVKGALGVVF